VLAALAGVTPAQWYDRTLGREAERRLATRYTLAWKYVREGGSRHHPHGAADDDAATGPQSVPTEAGRAVTEFQTRSCRESSEIRSEGAAVSGSSEPGWSGPVPSALGYLDD
jgi:hypothetical protein